MDLRSALVSADRACLGLAEPKRPGAGRALRTIPLLIVVCFVSFPAYAQYSGGTGEPNDPYQIATAEDLIALGETPEDYDKHFILTADIDLDPNLPGRKVFDRAVIAPDTNDVGSGFRGTLFTGVFDGYGHTISHLTVTGDDFLGLFGQVGSGGMICDLGLEESLITAKYGRAGALAGLNNGHIAAIYSSGMVSSNSHYVGGLVGRNMGSIVSSCSTAMASGGSNVGGLVGFSGGSILTSYSIGAVSGLSNVGGLVGWNYGFGTISESYSTGSVTGTREIGGLVGFNNGDCVTLCFWDMATSGQVGSAGGIGLTTAEMQDIDTYLSEGWDFVDETLNGSCDYWRISSGDYPRLRFCMGDRPALPEGSGTAEQPYMIRDAQDLGTVWFQPRSHYRLAGSIDLTGITWSMSVIPWFNGAFNGDGHVITNLHIEGGQYLGLFGQLVSAAEVSNLGLEAVDVYGTGNYVGGLAGRSYGTISRSYSTGVIRAIEYVGGLVGYSSGSIATSHTAGTASGMGRIGGLVGKSTGPITASYSVQTVSGVAGYIGGLVGSNFGEIVMSYSRGRVDAAFCGFIGGLVGCNYGSRFHTNISASFWDVQTSGQSGSSGGAGKTTAEMQTPGTFLEAGWDFVGESENGTEDIWVICEGAGYPHLAWEFVIGDFDADADTDFADFCILAEHWLAADGSFWCGQGCDLTNDGSVDWQDLMVITENWPR